ncbi:hypothetical protein VNO78_25484 [Psophocarpus tetragonolobus]|uniref:Uncharacterized protein n=1 Tax=Psophocarpus tetragonolobus TaxID=3891 RepID=A0AAN9S7G9_PSOTE
MEKYRVRSSSFRTWLLAQLYQNTGLWKAEEARHLLRTQVVEDILESPVHFREEQMVLHSTNIDSYILNSDHNIDGVCLLENATKV